MNNITVDSQGNIWETTIATMTDDYCQVINSFGVYIKKLTENAQIPARGSDQAAGYDLYADLGDEKEITIAPGATKFIGTGLSFALPHGTFLGIYPRSGLACKQGLRPANCVGVVDSDFRGEVEVALHNDSEDYQTIVNGERIAQGILQTYLCMSFIEKDELPETSRGIGGFGSTGSK